MKHALAWRPLCALMLCVGVLSANAGVAAEPTPWRHIGQHPNTAPINVACENLARVSDISKELCLKGEQMRLAGDDRCDIRVLEDGEEVYTTFSRDSQHGAEYKRVELGLPDRHPDRVTVDCNLGDGIHYLYPSCGNPSLQRRAVEQPVQARNCRLECGPSSSQTMYSGTRLGGQLICGHFIPGHSTGAIIDGGSGQSCVTVCE